MSFASYHANSVAPAVMQTLVPLQTEPPEANLRVCISVLKDLSPRTTSMRDTLLWAGMTSVSTIKDGIQMTLKSEEFQSLNPGEYRLKLHYLRASEKFSIITDRDLGMLYVSHKGAQDIPTVYVRAASPLV